MTRPQGGAITATAGLAAPVAPQVSNTWIVSTSLDKPDHETRHFIRSHVMKGKNTGAKKRVRTKKAQKPVEETVPEVPRKFTSEMQTFNVGVPLSDRTRELVHRAFTMIKPPTPPLRGRGEPPDHGVCFETFVDNVALLNTTLFMAQMYRDMTVDRLAGPSAKARYYLGLVLKELGEWVQDEERATSDATMSVVASLTMSAVFMGDVDAAQKHLNALHHIVTSSKTPKSGFVAEYKVKRVDFGLSLASGNAPKFMSEGPSFRSETQRDNKRYHLPELEMITPRPDPRLLNVWVDLRTFAHSQEQVQAAQSPGGSDLLAAILRTAPPRLLALDYGPISTSELLRLCMLMVIKSVISPVPGMGKTLKYLSHRLKLNIMVIADGGDRQMRPLLLWASVLAAIFVFEDFDREWLQRIIERTARLLRVNEWWEFKAMMAKHIWLEAVCEARGKQLFKDWIAPNSAGSSPTSSWDSNSCYQDYGFLPEG